MARPVPSGLPAPAGTATPAAAWGGRLEAIFRRRTSSPHPGAAIAVLDPLCLPPARSGPVGGGRVGVSVLEGLGAQERKPEGLQP
ncbi:MAG: hypothetical protein WBH85_13180, partial [Thermoanaerobaculia bacterium]